MNLYNMANQTEVFKRTIIDTKKKPIDLKVAYGSTLCEYTIDAIQNTSNLSYHKDYMVTVKKRVTIEPYEIFIPGASVLGGIEKNIKFVNYPILIANKLSIEPQEGTSIDKIMLLNVSPKTMNSSHNSTLNYSLTGNQGTSNSAGTQKGLSNSSTTSYDYSAGGGGGFGMGSLLMNTLGNTSVNVGHSTEKTKGNSKGLNMDTGNTKSNQSSTSNTVQSTIKDWSAYCETDDKCLNPTWYFAQVYPFDIIKFKQILAQDDNYAYINAPFSMKSQMLNQLNDNNYLCLPPSHLSQFGIDIVISATWLITLKNDPHKQSVTEKEIVINHETVTYKAAHQASDSPAENYLQLAMDMEETANKELYSSNSLDLDLYSLVPIGSNQSAVNLNQEKNETYDYLPTKQNNYTFKIVSRFHNLQVNGKNFLKVNQPDMENSPSITMQFKITDLEKNHYLQLKHWVANKNDSVEIDISLNDVHINNFTVDSLKGEGGKDNIDRVQLRNLDFNSKDFNDNLILGLNKITINFSQETTSNSNSPYTLSYLEIL